MFEETELNNNYYDVLVAFEVLEHTISPKSFLKKANEVLIDGGAITIEVPNHDDVLLSCYDSSTYEKFYYHKAHIHYFTPQSLVELCSDCGFIGKSYSFLMYPFFNHVYWAQNNKPQGSAYVALDTPIPTDGKSEINKEINDFYKKVELEYEKIINKNNVGDCLIFKGIKK